MRVLRTDLTKYLPAIADTTATATRYSVLRMSSEAAVIACISIIKCIKCRAQLKELYTLLNENYVEDDDNMFRFDYAPEFLLWYVRHYKFVVCS